MEMYAWNGYPCTLVLQITKEILVLFFLIITVVLVNINFSKITVVQYIQLITTN